MNTSTASSPAARCANAAIACFAVFVLGLAALHLLRPDYALSSHMISDYAVGPWGSLMTIAFAGMGLGCLMLALAIAGSQPRSAATWFAAAMLAVISIGTVVTAAFPTDLPGAPSTRSGDIHAMSFYVNVMSLVMAAAAMAIAAQSDLRWRSHRWAVAALALLLVLALILQVKTLHRGMPYGLANRFFVVAMMLWLFFIAIRQRQISRSNALSQIDGR